MSAASAKSCVEVRRAHASIEEYVHHPVPYALMRVLMKIPRNSLMLALMKTLDSSDQRRLKIAGLTKCPCEKGHVFTQRCINHHE
mmetsp:Transcript_10943/g.17908  ORF Transcript_10943/g.17908 Transcript_10943/m.17908 type:complete len:85 (-) Transcript_10943:529-783(-)